MAASTVEVPVFTDTNLGTHIAMAVSPDITAGDFKREVERMHFNCFPKSGEIRIHGLMVKRKSCFYYLPESLPIKYAFQGKKGTWFLHVEARPLGDLNRPGLPKGVATKVVDHIYNNSNATVSLEPQNFLAVAGKTDSRREGKKRSLERSNCFKPFLQEFQSTVSLSKEEGNKRLKKNNLLEYTASGIKIGRHGSNEQTLPVTAKGKFGCCAYQNEVESREELSSSSPMVEAPGEMSSEVSVSGIIKRYFPSFSELSSFGSPPNTDVDVTSRTGHSHTEEQLKTRTDNKCSIIQLQALPEFTVKTPPRMLPSPFLASPSEGTLRDRHKRSKIGKRLIVASSNVKISESKKKPAISLCRSKNGIGLGPNSYSLFRSSVFEISDNDD